MRLIKALYILVDPSVAYGAFGLRLTVVRLDIVAIVTEDLEHRIRAGNALPEYVLSCRYVCGRKSPLKVLTGLALLWLMDSLKN